MSPESHGMSGTSWLGDPIDARALFGPELRSLLDTPRGLTPSDWSGTAAGHWTVHDVAAHLLGDYYGRLGHDHRNGFADGETVEAFIHRTNQEWVDLHADDSPASLIDALAAAGTRLVRRFATADLDAVALGVSWTATATADRWSLAEAPSGRPTAAVLLDTETVWRLSTRNIDPADALSRAQVRGDRRLAEAACRIVSIVY
ncbi:maleylpyruvate isomerase N-terminal domain-containing protein [Streptomyces sp. NPDC000348]|uniref:maleylpyruvate isomerase N-terminal domain-containing protein n=1 Tax=Streptomyces sp. NPDC000348 TaxID=3364538 RepID=UPI0036B13F6C